jgi:hypothetical protein
MNQFTVQIFLRPSFNFPTCDNKKVITHVKKAWKKLMICHKCKEGFSSSFGICTEKNIKTKKEVFSSRFDIAAFFSCGFNICQIVCHCYLSHTFQFSFFSPDSDTLLASVTAPNLELGRERVKSLCLLSLISCRHYSMLP